MTAINKSNKKSEKYFSFNSTNRSFEKEIQLIKN